MRAPAPRWCAHERAGGTREPHRHHEAALGSRDDEQLRHAAGGAGQRRRCGGHRRGRQDVPGPAGRHRGQRSRPSPPGRDRGRDATDLDTLGHTSNLYVTEPAVALAEELVALLGADAQARVFFCNSGTEANELAFKLSRLTGRTKLVAAQGRFHGRTMGSLALTGQPAKQAPFEPLPGDVSHVPYGDTDALAAAVGDDTAAVFLEPIMGERAVVVPPEGYLAAARDITARHGALLVLDEVQTGMGRTGAFFAHQHDGITPDVVTLAKGLGGGLPIGAVLGHRARRRFVDTRPARQHLRRQPGVYRGGPGGGAGAGRRRPGAPCRAAG